MNFPLLSCLTSFGSVHLLYKPSIRRVWRRTKVTWRIGHVPLDGHPFYNQVQPDWVHLFSDFCLGFEFLSPPLCCSSSAILRLMYVWLQKWYEKHWATQTNLQFLNMTWTAFMYYTNRPLIKKYEFIKRKIPRDSSMKGLVLWLLYPVAQEEMEVK